jgi:addiction module HigA family antidote
MEMFDPPHPGESIREDCIKAVGLTVTAAAAELGISRQSLSEILNGHNGVSADMALRLEEKGWDSAEGWLRNQASYDLWQARQAKALAAKRNRLDASTDDDMLKLRAELGGEREETWKNFHAAGAEFRAHGSGHAHGSAGPKKSAAKRAAKKTTAKRHASQNARVRRR